MSNTNKSKPNMSKASDKVKRSQNKRPRNTETTAVTRPSAAWSETVAIQDAINDPEWYAAIPELMVSSASLSFFNPVGAPTHFGEGSFNPGTLESIPGICAIPYQPVLGVSKDNASPTNLASRDLFTFVHKVMAVGSSSYEPADYMLYTMAMASAYSFLAWMRRVYGTISLYTQLNKYLPGALLDAMGVDDKDLQDKGMSLYYYISVYQNKLGSFAIPTSLSYFTRQMWMCSNLYLDHENSKGQIYMFNPTGFWRYNEYDGAGELDFVPLPSLMKLEDIVSYGDALLSWLVASEDIYTMSGDTLHAFGDKGIFKMDALAPDYMVTPWYVPEVITQIHNATIFVGRDPNFTKITQNTETGINGGAIMCAPTVLGDIRADTSDIMDSDRLLTMPSDLPSPAEVMVATRLAAFAKAKDDARGVLEVTSCGTELLFTPRIYRFTNNSGTSEWQWVRNYGAPYCSLYNGDTVPITWPGMTSAMSVFANHPFMGLWVYNPDDPDEPKSLSGYEFDVDNYTVVDRRTIDRMHQCALMSMYSVPVMGLFNRKTT